MSGSEQGHEPQRTWWQGQRRAAISHVSLTVCWELELELDLNLELELDLGKGGSPCITTWLSLS